MVITTTVMGLLSADVTIDIVDYFNKFKTEFTWMASPKSSPKERTLKKKLFLPLLWRGPG
jgi:hypothetical protein